MRSRSALLLMIFLAGCARGPETTAPKDDRFVVLGPSLVELMFTCGLGDRVVGIDRYSQWPPQTEDIPKVGGYIDPSIERIASLSPTSIHISGGSAVIREFADDLGIPCYTYNFDSLGGVFEALDSLDARYGAGAAEFRVGLERTLDSLALVLVPVAPLEVMVVVYHETGASSMTVAGESTFFSDILDRLGCRICSPGTGSWPMISAEGAVSLDPDHVICLFPGRTDTAEISGSEDLFWGRLGFGGNRVHCLFHPCMMIPGGRLGVIAEEICSCLL
ncbi:MAG: ABC transporter substrate-binding protein [Candidatus Fermentibacteraceae bacterium]|nr:ABC transporter substrate-binding protein [Candidatus Fermentibacteraceae bacterium]MBN2609864.1 ABC transporter substrate-binding protein [Candidatus Fermentibacteraceae bacterium]